MSNLRLLFVLALTAICIPASAQSPTRPGLGQFPGGLQTPQFSSPRSLFDPQAGAAIFDDGAGYGGANSDYLDVIDSTALPADCGYGCPPAWTSEMEAFYLNREGNDRFSSSLAFVLSDFDYQPGVRVTLHRHFDCLDGWDVTYTGGFDWFEQSSAVGPGLNSVFGADGVDISTFNNADLHLQSSRSRLNSIELTRKWYGWDVFEVGLGVRYLNVEEDYLFSSIRGGNLGSLNVETNNNMGGVQLSLAMKIPIGNWTSMTRFKGGLFGNAMDGRTGLVNAGSVEINNAADNLRFASIIEFGYYLRHRLSERVSLQAGYEVWWLYGLAIANEQVPAILTPLTGARLDGNGDTWYHGGTVGVEIIF